jgi:large subunit ribosomal protein L15
MKLGTLKPPTGARQKRKRVGRGHGSGWGKSAGRGDKGAGQRSGFKHRPWFEGGQMPLQRRLPKRGFSNKIFKKEYQIVNLEALNKLDVDTVDAQVLYQKGLVRSAYQPIKILGRGGVDRPLQVTASAFSRSAREKIEQAGGTATELC